MPAFMVLVFNNFRAFVFGLTAVYAVTFAAGIGALRRNEWARQVLIAVFSLAAAGMAVMAVVMQIMMNDMFRETADVPPDAMAMVLAMRAFSVVFAFLFVGGFGWLAYKFSTPAIRSEFS